MKSFRDILFFLILFTPLLISAQKEASIWSVGAGKQFNFQTGNFEFSDFQGNPGASASICDKDGNLVLCTDGRTVWNKFNEVVKNGDKLISDDMFLTGKPIFVPYPKKEGWYILFYAEDDYTISHGMYQNRLYFAEINSNANNGKGEVVRQKIKVHDNFHSGPTIAGYCDNSYFWLVNDRNDNTQIEKGIDRIYFYKIDENGVNLVPVINDNFDIGSSGSYRFSPNGDKFFFIMGGNSSDGEVITDFNFETGKIYNPRILTLGDVWTIEFSPDSRLLYYRSGGNLMQINAEITDNKAIYNTIDTILTLPQTEEYRFPIQDLRLAPDGKIYIYYFDVLSKKFKLGRINKPNIKGLACEPELNLATIESYDFRFPDFVTSFFRDKTPEKMDEVFPDAGKDIVICSNSTAVFGYGDSADVFYKWSPESDLSNPFSLYTVFSPGEFYDYPRYSEYVLRGTDGNCWVNFDTLHVMTTPVPRELPVDGSWSVCPFVEEVDYWTVTENTNLHWLVSGGEIVSNPANDNVKINWGETNMHASASVYSTNSFGCSDTSVFPVRINVELITETPKGPDKICVAERENVVYYIKNTNGSVYEWITEGGKVVKGQGTNNVVVNWLSEGKNKISVKETSVTIDTICFGESQPLIVDVINDSLKINLSLVSFTPENNLVITYDSDNLKNNIHSLFLVEFDQSGSLLAETNFSSLFTGKFYYTTSVPDSPEIIGLKVINSCNETFYSNRFEPVILDGFENKTQNKITLNWNINRFWENDRLEHEIWYSENDLNGWDKIENVQGTGFEYQLKGISLTHFFRIREVNLDKNVDTWSNTIKIEVEGELTIPDVFTPNGDGINDDWQIKNIGLYRLTQLVIYDRNGKVVYECKNSYIPWNGRVNGEIIQGTYLYQLLIEGEDYRYGQVTVLR